VDAQPLETFGQVLRRLRQDAGMTIEDLAHRTGLGVRTISGLERDEGNSPRMSTVSRLAEALRLGEPGRTWLWAVVKGQPETAGPPATRVTMRPHTLPRDISSFVGRSAELAMLVDEAPGGGVVTIHAIAGMAGIGKTALAVRAAHQLTTQFPDGQVFLRLNGHTPGQRPMDTADALASLLQAAGVDARQVPAGLDDRARLWRHWLAGKRVLLLLDDAIGSEQVRPLLPGTAGSLVLITSRRNLTALEGARSVSLDVLTADEAASLLVKLGGRPELRPDDPALARLAELCGNLPLAVGMLGGQLHHNRAWTPADMVNDLLAARDQLAQLQAEETSVAAAFDLSYRDLTSAQQRVFRRLGLHPGTDTDAWAAAALSDVSPADALRCLRALRDQNMIAEPSHGRYRLHDLIRAYAASRAAAEDPPAERDAALVRLLDFYRRAGTLAGRYLARRTPSPAPGTGDAAAGAPEISGREQAASWMAAESLNLQAAAAYAAGSGRPHALAIAAAMHGFLRGRGSWDRALELHKTALMTARRLGDLPGEANALTDMGDVQYLMGNYAAAERSLTRALDLAQGLGDALAEASALIEFGVLRQATGDLASAEASLSRALDLSRSSGDRLGEANALNNLGIVQFMAGNFTAAVVSQGQALTIYRSLGDRLGEASALNSLGGVQQATGDYRAAIASLTQALALYGSLGDRVGQAYATGNLGAVQCIIGDYPAASANLNMALDLYQGLGRRSGEADMLSNLGVLYRVTGDHSSAIVSLTQAIALYRDLEDPLGEAGSLSELGVAHHETGDYRAAVTSLTQAVELAHDLGERADEAQALNNLGDLYLDTAVGAGANEAYSRALAIAADIDLPLEQARALEGTGRCLLVAGQRATGSTMLQEALAIYERIRSGNAERVAALLRELNLCAHVPVPPARVALPCGDRRLTAALPLGTAGRPAPPEGFRAHRHSGRQARRADLTSAPTASEVRARPTCRTWWGW